MTENGNILNVYYYYYYHYYAKLLLTKNLVTIQILFSKLLHHRWLIINSLNQRMWSILT